MSSAIDWGEMRPHLYADFFPLLGAAELRELADDVKDRKLLHPIVRFEGQILDGRNRYLACRMAGVPARFEDFHGTAEEALALVVSENVKRRHLTTAQRAEIAPKVHAAAEENARKRQEASRARPGERIGKAPANLREPSATAPAKHERTAAADTAKLLGISPRTVESALAVDEKGTPELKAALKEGKVSVSAAAEIATVPPGRQREIAALSEKEILAAAKTIKAKKHEEKRAAKVAVVQKIAAESLSFPEGPFRVLAVDPPWKYDTRADDASHRARNPYPDMTVEEIKGLPVKTLAHKDAVLWLWTTNAFLRDAFDIATAWGFTTKTVLTWDKGVLGLGDWLRNVTEHCLLCVRGKPVVTLANQTTLIREKRREHSRKPEAFYALVETLCHGNRVELFARSSRDGWSRWGAESEKFDAA